MTARYPISRPLLGDAELDASRRVLESGWVMQGPEVAAFEKDFANFVGAAHACAVSSGTAALHLALLSLGIGPGDEVVTVSHSFIATANSVRLCGAEPVFVDIDPTTYNLDPGLVARALTPRTRAILCVHQLGMPCDLRALSALAVERSVPLVEDAACAVGSEIDWQGKRERIGRPHGVAACFSFHPRKIVTTGDGGMITTHSAELDARVRRLRQHGVLAADEAPRVVGYNYRLTDLQAAIGRAQLERLPAFVAERRRLAARYAERLAGSAVAAPVEPAWARSNWQSYCVRLPDGAAQRTVMERLEQEGISTRSGLVNAHEQPVYSSALRPALPESERAHRQCLLLPLYPGLTEADVDRIVTELLRSIA